MGKPRDRARSDVPALPRRFDDEQTALILGRAAETERWTGPLPSRGEFTLDDIVSIGREVGLDPATVRRAAGIVPVMPGPVEGFALGGSARPTVRARFEGRVPRGRYAELTDALDSVFGTHGTTSQSEGAYEWNEEYGPGRTSVHLTFGETETQVRVEADRRGWVILTAIGSIAGAIIGVQLAAGVLGVLASLGPGVAVLLPTVLASAGLRFVFPRLKGDLEENIQRAVAHVGSLIEAVPPGRPTLPEKAQLPGSSSSPASEESEGPTIL